MGVHPNYPKRQDVEIQTGLVRPDIQIVYSLDELTNQIYKFSFNTVKVNTIKSNFYAEIN